MVLIIVFRKNNTNLQQLYNINQNNQLYISNKPIANIHVMLVEFIAEWTNFGETVIKSLQIPQKVPGTIHGAGPMTGDMLGEC
jgi:hypothetical protein